MGGVHMPPFCHPPPTSIAAVPRNERRAMLDPALAAGAGGSGVGGADVPPPLRGLSAGDVVDPVEACLALRIEPTAGRSWLSEHALICRVSGQERVVWGDVLAAVRAGTVFNAIAVGSIRTSLRQDGMPAVGTRTEPVDGAKALSVPVAAARFGPSESTIYRMLSVLPAPLMLGAGTRSLARWPDEASFRSWLQSAQRLRGGSAHAAPPARRRMSRRATPLNAGPGPFDFGALARDLIEPGAVAPGFGRGRKR